MTITTKELEKQADELNRMKPLIGKLKEDHALIQAKLNQFDDYIKTFEQLNQDAIKIKKIMDDSQINWANDEKEWKDVKEKLATTSLKGKVTLNVGGDKFQTSVETLTKEKGTFFTALFSKQWPLEKDDEGCVFIDRNGKLFTYILEYLRTGEVHFDQKNAILRKSLSIEAKYYQLNRLIALLSLFPGSTLITEEQSYKLNDFYGNTNQQWILLYKATKDGFDAASFHRLCDGKGPTMTIIQSNS
ncbi:unnamed protein product, partial [Didymodactylos carnosus]